VIAREAGISQSYLFRLFRTKKEPFLAAGERAGTAPARDPVAGARARTNAELGKLRPGNALAHRVRPFRAAESRH
jgi:AcrR family transcriptional regulator